MRTTMMENEPLTPGTCEWCGNPTELENVACSLSCEAQLHRLEALQGRAVLRNLKRWRKHRGRKGTPGEGQMTEVAAMVDRFLRNDRKRREDAQTAKRIKAAEKVKKADVSSEPPAQTAAPISSPPEDWRENKTEEGYNG